jgi:DNA-directed RNA polymerase subunit RPC12/RpoP
MIHIKCMTCGWRLPFSSKENEDNVKCRGLSDIKCPNCGKMLIQTKYL